MPTPTPSPSYAITADAILEKWRKYEIAHLASMIDKCDLETAEAALGCLSRYRVQTLSDIDKIHAQYPASNLEWLEDAVDAVGVIIQHK